MATPVTHYAKSGDVHIAIKSLAAGRSILSWSPALCRTSRTTGMGPISRAGSFIWAALLAW
jgi:hypothetical protein